MKSDSGLNKLFIYQYLLLINKFPKIFFTKKFVWTVFSGVVYYAETHVLR